MPTIRPFCALRYDDTKVALERVLVPPPERADDVTRDAHYDADPRNIIRVLANRPEEGDAEASALCRAKTFLAQWRRARVVVQDEDPAYYVLRQRFTADGVDYVRTGVYGALEVSRSAVEAIRPHEETLDGRHHEVTKVADATGVQLEPISLLVADDKSRMLRALSAELEEEPDVRVVIEGCTHELWIVDDETTCARVEQALVGATMVIADGHHRFAAAVARYEDTQAPQRLAVFMTPAQDEGVRILPTHRLVEGSTPIDVVALLDKAGEGFRIKKIEVGDDEEIPALDTDEMEFVVVSTSGLFRLAPTADHIAATLRDHAPDPAIAYADTTVLDSTFVATSLQLAGGDVEARTRFVRDARYVREAVKRKEGRAVGFLVRAPTVEQVLATANAEHVLPPKSTAFRPRLTCGLVMLPTQQGNTEG